MKSLLRTRLTIFGAVVAASNTAGVDRALRAYAKLTRLGLDVLRPGGTLVQASCSSRVTTDQFYDTVHAAALGEARKFEGGVQFLEPVENHVELQRRQFLLARPDHQKSLIIRGQIILRSNTVQH
jgi:hypothetical protein